METELIILFGSAIFIIVGIILWRKGSHLLSNGKKAKAVIFKNNVKRSGSDGDLYYPVVRFTTDEQIWITQELSIGYSSAKPEGTKLEVIYDPEDPTIVEINSSFQLEIFPRLLTAIGIVGFIWASLEYLNLIQTLG